MNEKEFLIRSKGGPTPGDIKVSTTLMSWPLPDQLQGDPSSNGVYVKVGESRITNEQAEVMDMTHVMRGAMYEWRDNAS